MGEREHGRYLVGREWIANGGRKVRVRRYQEERLYCEKARTPSIAPVCSACQMFELQQECARMEGHEMPVFVVGLPNPLECVARRT